MMPVNASVPEIIAHRGVPGLRLEHTAASHHLAAESGADYIEPDVVATQDGHLVVRHENEIGHTTDIADRPEFAARRTEKTIDGVTKTGWFSEDFTLTELKTLRCREALPDLRPANRVHDDQHQILTFDEYLDIADEHGVPIYVETKHPTHFLAHGLDLNAMVLEVLERRGRNTQESRDIIQSFEVTNLRQLRSQTPLRLVQLVGSRGAPADLVAAGDPRTFADLLADLDELATYADGIGPHKSLVIDPWPTPTDLVERAHAAGLLVHLWTMRDENHFLPTALREGDDPRDHGRAIEEYFPYFDAGVDALFTDFTPTAVEARRQWLART